jgi:oligopeptide/dipeptide ABC transporter ATP-binding protein
MYAGEIVEQAEVQPLFQQPKHPYTQGLIASVPKLGEVKNDLDVIPGGVPNLIDLPPGSRFAPRCRARVENGLAICLEQRPELKEVEPGHEVRCWLYEPGVERHPPVEVAALEGPA